MIASRISVLMLLLTAIAPVGAQPTPLNSSVLILDQRTLLRASELVERAAELGNRRVMFVITVQCRLTPLLRVRELGLMIDRQETWESPENFVPLDDSKLAEFTDRLAAAFEKAVGLGLDIAVLPHYDPAGEILEWRNLYEFDPYEECKGYSYVTALIDPTIKALRRTAKPTTRIQFSLSGEMGRSLFMHPTAYRRLAKHTREKLEDWPLEVGIGLNHSDVAGEHIPTSAQQQEMQNLVNECDYVGFSNYSPFQLPPRAEQFAESCQKFLDELASHSIEVPESTSLHFTEIGLGGHGTAPETAAAKPWEGTGDPGINPWLTVKMVNFRRDYHRALMEFLQKQQGPRRVSAAYFWSEGSWEPQGMDNPAFADPILIERIRRHNLAIQQ